MQIPTNLGICIDIIEITINMLISVHMLILIQVCI